MAGGYIGKLLFVNLSTGEFKEETPDESLFRDFIGCFGVGARILYSRQRGGADPLGPENTLGFVTGPLTGTPAVTGCRFAVVAKSPLTGGWGDSSCGGDFGPSLKFAGYDGVFITGVSPKPIYLIIDNGKAQIRDASHLWGKTTFETDDAIKAELGKDVKVVSIGPAGERQSLVSCLMNYGGDAAGRSGLGAVAGSKKLKAVVVRGEGKVPLADVEAVNRIREAHMAEAKQAMEGFRMTGTSGHSDGSVHSGDTPVKNWGGIGVNEMPDVSGLHKDVLNANVARRTACWHCPVACKGRLREGTGDYRYPADTHRPEYETAAAFGAMCCNTNAESIAMATHICNAYGLDTISTGTIIAFAMECYQHGIITKKDTDGIELTWGNHRAMIAMTEKIAKGDGFGDVLADGVRKAAERIGRGAEEYAVHIGGQELGLHDPKFDFPFFRGKPTAARYQMDATPGRHTAGFGPSQFEDHALSASGLCLHSDTLVRDPSKYITGYMSAVTGRDYNMDVILECGERIANIRHVFTLREGINPLQLKVHGRIIGRPPFSEGPLAGVSLDIEAQAYWNLGALDWDRVTTKPSRQKLLQLGLNDIAEELWPPQPGPGPGPR
jgi:aldehyde:ferredoxin oxidoreductase